MKKLIARKGTQAARAVLYRTMISGLKVAKWAAKKQKMGTVESSICGVLTDAEMARAMPAEMEAEPAPVPA